MCLALCPERSGKPIVVERARAGLAGLHGDVLPPQFWCWCGASGASGGGAGGASACSARAKPPNAQAAAEPLLLPELAQTMPALCGSCASL